GPLLLRAPAGTETPRAGTAEELLQHHERQAQTDRPLHPLTTGLQHRDEDRVLAVRDLDHVRDGFEAAERQVEADVLLPRLRQLRGHPVRDDPHHALLHHRQRPGHLHRLAAAAQQPVEHHERQVGIEVDQQLLATRVRHIVDVGAARRRHREHQLAEAVLIHARHLQVHLLAHPAPQPPLERLRHLPVDRTQRTQPVLREPAWLAEVVRAHRKPLPRTGPTVALRPARIRVHDRRRDHNTAIRGWDRVRPGDRLARSCHAGVRRRRPFASGADIRGAAVVQRSTLLRLVHPRLPRLPTTGSRTAAGGSGERRRGPGPSAASPATPPSTHRDGRRPRAPAPSSSRGCAGWLRAPPRPDAGADPPSPAHPLPPPSSPSGSAAHPSRPGSPPAHRSCASAPDSQDPSAHAARGSRSPAPPSATPPAASRPRRPPHPPRPRVPAAAQPPPKAYAALGPAPGRPALARPTWTRPAAFPPSLPALPPSPPPRVPFGSTPPPRKHGPYQSATARRPERTSDASCFSTLNYTITPEHPRSRRRTLHPPPPGSLCRPHRRTLPGAPTTTTRKRTPTESEDGDGRTTRPPPSSPVRTGRAARLALQVHQLLQHLVAGRDHPRVGLEAPLRDDHVGELLGEVHVRHLERAGRDRGRAALAREPDHRRAGIG